MKHLILVRHGQYGPDGNLDTNGQYQIESLAQSIKEIIGAQRPSLLYSTASRTIQTAYILTRALNAQSEACADLRVEGNIFLLEARTRLHNLITAMGKNNDVIILVTHLPVIHAIGLFISQEYFGQTLLFEVGMGQAIHFDIGENTYELLPRATQ